MQIIKKPRNPFLAPNDDARDQDTPAKMAAHVVDEQADEPDVDPTETRTAEDAPDGK